LNDNPFECHDIFAKLNKKVPDESLLVKLIVVGTGNAGTKCVETITSNA